MNIICCFFYLIGSKERLLEQRIPASYLALEDVVSQLALERRVKGRDPVLPADKYQQLVTQEMAERQHRPFRDLAELNQGTTFLHENCLFGLQMTT